MSILAQLLCWYAVACAVGVVFGLLDCRRMSLESEAEDTALEGVHGLDPAARRKSHLRRIK